MALGNRFIGIQGKTSLIFIGVFIAIILPVNFLVYTHVKKILIQADTRELLAEGEKLFGQVRVDPVNIPLPAGGYSLYVRLNNLLGTDSIYASTDFPVELAWIEEQSPLEIDTLKIITLARPVEFGNSQLLFSLARSNQPLENQLVEMRIYLFAANLFSILLAGILVYVVSGYTLRPIKNIIKVAGRINATKSMERVPIPLSKDENRELAITINAMLERIENSIKNQTNFFASATHELKTPLTVMQTELSVALSQSTEGDKQILQNQLQEVQRLDRIIQDFLLISQLKAETLVFRKTTGRLDETLYAAIKRCKYLAREYNRSIKVILSETENYNAVFDLDKLEVVLTNLLENAIKYSKPDSVIEVSLVKNTHYELTIKNEVSKLIPDVERLKEEFRKSNELSAGLGMGLWICDQIIRMHGGELSLYLHGNFFEAKVRL